MRRTFLLAITLLLQCSLSTPSKQPNPGRQPKLSLTEQSSAPTQQPSRISVEDVVRITTTLVQVDAVVTDKSGRQITDLRADDFLVLQDGRPQRVAHLSYIATRSATTESTAKPAPTAKSSTPPVPVHLRPDQVCRTIALVVDDLGLSFASTAFVRKTLTRYVNEQMQPGDLVAIIRTSAGAGALQQFTNDKRQLLAAIDQVRWHPIGRGVVSAFTPEPTDELAQAAQGDPRAAIDAKLMAEAAAHARRELGQLREEVFAVGTLGAVGYVVRGLEKLPGRKSVLLLSDGFKLLTADRQKPEDPNREPGIRPSASSNTRILEALQRLTDAANRASVVIYTMDTRGLQTLTLTAEDNVTGLSPDRLEDQLLDRNQEFIDSQAGLAYLARLTGGLAIQNQNDLNKGIQRVLDDQSGYYLVGYYPDESTFDPKSGRPSFHKIAIKVNRPGLKIRSRSGFFGIADAEARERTSSNDNLANALASPFATADLRLRLTSLFGNDDQLGSLVAAALYIDGRDLTFKEQPDGSREAEIEVAAYTFGADGEVVDSLSRKHKVQARSNVYEGMLRDGLLYTINVPIKKPGAYQLRIAVRDSASKRLGTVSQFVEVPDLTTNRLALSGIFLSGLDPNKAQDIRSAEAGKAGDSQAIPALRRLRPGMEMHYAYYIYNAKLDVSSHPQLITQARVFRDGKLAYEGKVTPYDAGTEPDLKRLRAGGRLTLSTQAAPGEYALQIIVSDKLAQQKRSIATQWIDFEIVK